VLKLWEGLGYYTRARNLQKAAREIVRQFSGNFPDRFEDVIALPGVGRYTAGAICSIAFNQPAPILDGNVIRVLARVFGITENPRERPANEHLWRLAQSLVAAAAGSPGSPRDFRFSVPALRISGPCSALNQSLMELGALVCTPRQPRCLECPLRRHCVARREGRIDELPNLEKRGRPTARRFIAFAIEHQGRWLVRQRPTGVVNAQLWEFPNVEVNGGEINAARLSAGIIGARVSSLRPLRSIRHSITRYRISLEPFKGLLRRKPRASPRDARWLAPSEVEALTLASAHRRVWDQISPQREAAG
jgi:A/G-specific adenine glycosylase